MLEFSSDTLQKKKKNTILIIIYSLLTVTHVLCPRKIANRGAVSLSYSYFEYKTL